MILKEFIPFLKKENIALLYFVDEELKLTEVNEENIEEDFLKMEVMEVKQEEDCIEVWIK